MLAQLLPGLRDVRTPLVSGYLWIAAILVVVEDARPDLRSAPDAIASLIPNETKLWPVVVTGFVSVAAYIIGSLASELIAWVAKLRRRQALFGDAGTAVSAAGARDVEDAVNTRVAAIARRLDAAALEPGEGAVQRAPDIAAVQRELPVVRTRLLGEQDAIVAEVDRLQSEAEFRIACFFPAIAIVIEIAITESLWWLALGPLLVAVLIQGRRRHLQAGDRLASALRIGKAQAPSLAAFEASADAALAGVQQEGRLRTQRTEGEPLAAFQLGKLLSARGDRRGALEAFEDAAGREVIKAHLEAGRIHEILGDDAAAEKAYREADSRGDRRAPALLAELLARHQRPAEAEEAAARAEPGAEREALVRRLEERRAGDERDVSARAATGDADALVNVGLRLMGGRDAPAAAQALSAAVRAKGRLGAPPEELARILRSLAEAHRQSGAWEHAREALDRALELSQEALGEDHPDVVDAMVTLGLVLRESGDPDSSLSVLAQARDRAEDRLTDAALAQILRYQGQAELALGQVHQSVRTHEHAVKLEKAVGDSGRLVYGMGLLANALVEVDETDRALGTAQQARDMSKRLGIRLEGRASELVIAEILAQRDQTDRALAIIDEAFPDVIQGANPRPWYSSIRALRAEFLIGGDVERALMEWDAAVSLAVEFLGAEHPGTASAIAGRGRGRTVAGDTRAAVEDHETAIMILRRAGREERYLDAARILGNFAVVYEADGAIELALAASLRAVELLESQLGNRHSERRRGLTNLALVLDRLERHAEAATARKRAGQTGPVPEIDEAMSFHRLSYSV